MANAGMKKALFFSFLSVTIVLLAVLGLDAYGIGHLARRVESSVPELAAKGWHLSWRAESRQWRPWGSKLILSGVSLHDNQGHGWIGQSLSLGLDPFHPSDVILRFSGPQLLRVSSAIDLTTGEATGRFSPGSNTLFLRTPLVTASALPVTEIESVILRDVTIRVVPGLDAENPVPAWGIDLHAGSASPQFRGSIASESGAMAHLAALMPLMPPPRDLHVAIAALRPRKASLGISGPYERYLIQDAAITLGPLSCVARGTLGSDGAGTLWAHLSGLQGFTRYWIARAPEILRALPASAPFLHSLDEQSARIPDQFDLPVPVGGDDILLQNHFSTIITGHSR
ncbi:hypothetical protein AA0535_0553 [Asaia krungthepensis NRIC 0535]|uniref:DUF2125 domain-containing protein n=2 Tax=Asaia krungthepensis TaxID=220990 RepID=A0ABQ0PYA7_9PROT|nr:hypothetical protein AA0535_0553 [Asaia krungthepensis NRIC 0535]